MKADPLDPLGMLGREEQRPFGAPRQRDQHGALRGGRVHHRERVGGELLLPVRLGVGRPVRAAVAASVERDHPRSGGRDRGSAASSGANG